MAQPNPDSPYQVTFPASAIAFLRTLVDVAKERGIAFDFARDLEAIQHRLRNAPFEWGDPLFDYHHLGMTHYRGRSEFLFAYFSINQPARQVFVQRFTINPYSRLA
jgi:hypothetical protein